MQQLEPKMQEEGLCAREGGIVVGFYGTSDKEASMLPYCAYLLASFPGSSSPFLTSLPQIICKLSEKKSLIQNPTNSWPPS